MSKWKTVKLGEVATYINGFAFKPSDWCETGLPIIRIQNLTNSSKEINYYDKSYNPKYEVNKGDILISWSASLGVYEWKKGKALLNQHIFKVVFDKLDIDKKFFVYSIQTLLTQMAEETHGATMKHITKPKFDNMPFSLPPLEEQKRIADILDKASNLIELRKQQLEKMDLLIKSKFIDMFGDKGFPEMPLNKLCSIITDGTHQSPKFVEKGIPFLFISNIVDNKITYQTEKHITHKTYEALIKRTPIELGDILLTIVGSYGNPAIVENVQPFCFQRHIAYMKPIHEKINSYYLHAAFLVPQVRQQIDVKVKGIAQKTLNLSELKTVMIPVPPLALQKKFASFVEQVEKQKSVMQQSLEEMEINYKALLQKYFG